MRPAAEKKEKEWLISREQYIQNNVEREREREKRKRGSSVRLCRCVRRRRCLCWAAVSIWSRVVRALVLFAIVPIQRLVQTIHQKGNSAWGLNKKAGRPSVSLFFSVQEDNCAQHPSRWSSFPRLVIMSRRPGDRWMHKTVDSLNVTPSNNATRRGAPLCQSR